MDMTALNIRDETAADASAVREINIDAFKHNAEANLIETLRQRVSSLISLVAEESGKIVGHILFSPVRLEGCDKPLFLFGLGPMAVAPERQKQGVGSALVREGLKRCEEAGADAVVVLGHPDYYPKFGFEVSRTYGITSEYDVPDNLFMIVELKKGSLTGVSGTIKYREEFRVSE